MHWVFDLLTYLELLAFRYEMGGGGPSQVLVSWLYMYVIMAGIMCVDI